MSLKYRTLFKNPISIWLVWLFNKVLLERKFAGKKLSIGYLSSVVNCEFGSYNTLHSGVKLCNVSMGDFSYISTNSQVANTKIGKFVCIGPEVICGLGKHPTRDFVSLHPIFYSPNPQVQTAFVAQQYFDEISSIEIGNDVWLGARAIILDGVRIGNGAIIGAGAVVTKDVPPYAVVGGVPAKVIRYRFESDVIETLLRSKWWDRDINWLMSNAPSFLDVAQFVNGLRRN